MLHTPQRAPAAVRHPPPAVRHPGPATRVLDVTVAAVLLALLWPVLVAVAVAVAVRCTSRGPVLFRQERLGQGRRPFVMLKFRTMSAGCDDRLHREYVQALLAEPAVVVRTGDGLYKLPDDPRITRIGRWLRRSGLDELPQLVNVLRGEMALVGPRPPPGGRSLICALLPLRETSMTDTAVALIGTGPDLGLSHARSRGRRRLPVPAQPRPARRGGAAGDRAGRRAVGAVVHRRPQRRAGHPPGHPAAARVPHLAAPRRRGGGVLAARPAPGPVRDRPAPLDGPPPRPVRGRR
nr:sugar transferase [Petropleomorpha daqingensis]